MMRSFATFDAPSRERLEYWQETVSRTLVGIDCRTKGGPFEGRMMLLPACALTVSSLGAVPHVAERNHNIVGRSGDDFDMLFLQLKGIMNVEVGGDRFEVRPGEFYYYNGAMPHTLAFPEFFEHIAVRLPRFHATDRLRALRSMGSFRHSGQSGLARVAGSTLRGIVDMADTLDERAAGSAALAAVDMFLLAIEQDLSGAAGRPLRSSQLATIRRIRAVVEEHLEIAEFAPKALAGIVGLSERHLNRLLALTGTSIRAMIRDARLERADRYLADPAKSRTSVTEIAFACGFSDASAFSRAYRAVYGRAPRDRRVNLH